MTDHSDPPPGPNAKPCPYCGEALPLVRTAKGEQPDFRGHRPNCREGWRYRPTDMFGRPVSIFVFASGFGLRSVDPIDPNGERFPHRHSDEETLRLAAALKASGHCVETLLRAALRLADAGESPCTALSLAVTGAWSLADERKMLAAGKARGTGRGEDDNLAALEKEPLCLLAPSLLAQFTELHLEARGQTPRVVECLDGRPTLVPWPEHGRRPGDEAPPDKRLVRARARELLNRRISPVLTQIKEERSHFPAPIEADDVPLSAPLPAPRTAASEAASMREYVTHTKVWRAGAREALRLLGKAAGATRTHRTAILAAESERDGFIEEGFSFLTGPTHDDVQRLANAYKEATDEASRARLIERLENATGRQVLRHGDGEIQVFFTTGLGMSRSEAVRVLAERFGVTPKTIEQRLRDIEEQRERARELARLEIDARPISKNPDLPSTQKEGLRNVDKRPTRRDVPNHRRGCRAAPRPTPDLATLETARPGTAVQQANAHSRSLPGRRDREVHGDADVRIHGRRINPPRRVKRPPP